MRHLAPAALFLSLLAAACSSSSSSGGGSSSTPCNEDPWQCPSSQTCWPQSASAFACLNAGPGTVGSACQDTVGTPSCGAGLFCFMGVSSPMGTCLAYCSTSDPNHACEGGTCQPVALGGANGPQVTVCVPMIATGGGDSGTGPDGNGTADGGSDAPAGG